MRELGVREFKESLSETLRAVGRGERIRVTLRGRPFVDLVPPGGGPESDGFLRLVAEGRLVMESMVHPRRAPPLAKASHSASLLVIAERDECC